MYGGPRERERKRETEGMDYSITGSVDNAVATSRPQQTLSVALRPINPPPPRARATTSMPVPMTPPPPNTTTPLNQAVKGDIHLASISGGTDILGCFALGNPTLPVRAGHLQCLGLGMDVCAYRSGNDEDSGGGGGSSDGVESSIAASSRVAAREEMGELVCR